VSSACRGLIHFLSFAPAAAGALCLPHPQKKVGTLPIENSEEVKRTNEIKMAIPMLDAIDISGKDVSADALLTQRESAEYLVTKRNAHYLFTVKGNQRGVLRDPDGCLCGRREAIPDFRHSFPIST
jgi:hypothetical protein